MQIIVFILNDDPDGQISAPGIQIFNTPGIIPLAVRKGVLTIQQADEIKGIWNAIAFTWGLLRSEILCEQRFLNGYGGSGGKGRLGVTRNGI